MATNKLSINIKSKKDSKFGSLSTFLENKQKKEDVEISIYNFGTQEEKKRWLSDTWELKRRLSLWPEIGSCALLGSRSSFLTPPSGWNSFRSLVPWFLVLYFCPVASLLPSRMLLNLSYSNSFSAIIFLFFSYPSRQLSASQP